MKSTVLVALFSMSLFAGCSRESAPRVSADAYDDLARRFEEKNQVVQKLNRQKQSSESELLATNEFIAVVDDRVQRFQTLVRQLDGILSNEDLAAVRAFSGLVEDAKTAALNSIAILESQSSIKNVDVLEDDAETQRRFGEKIASTQSSTSSLEGLRDVVQTQYDAVSTRLKVQISVLENQAKSTPQ